MRSAFVAAAVAGLALFVPLQRAAAAEDSPELNVSAVDATAYPTVSVEVSVPGGVSGDADIGPTLRVTNGRPVAAKVEPMSADGLEVVLLFDVSGSVKRRRLRGSQVGRPRLPRCASRHRSASAWCRSAMRRDSTVR